MKNLFFNSNNEKSKQIHLIATTLSYKNEKKRNEKGQIGIN